MEKQLNVTPDICASKEYSLKQRTISSNYLNEKAILMYMRKCSIQNRFEITYLDDNN